MDISAALAASLAALTQALDAEDINLETELRSFAADVQRAVSSYTGMTMTIAVNGHSVTFTANNNLSTARSASGSSLMIPLAELTTSDPASDRASDAGSDAGSTLVLYAAVPGAFVDLAADLNYGLGLDPTTLILDGHLPAPEASSSLTGMDAYVAINRAIGVLIARGHTPETAHDELHRLADLDHGELRAAAEQVLRTLRPT